MTTRDIISALWILLACGCSDDIGRHACTSAESTEVSVIADDPIIEGQPWILTHVGNIINGMINARKDSSFTENWPLKLDHVRRKLRAPINSREQYMEVLATIPEEMIAGYNIGTTLETNGCFVTSIDPSKIEESLWITVIGAKMGEDMVVSSSIW